MITTILENIHGRNSIRSTTEGAATKSWQHLVRGGIYIFIVPFYVVFTFIIEDKIEEMV